MEFGRNFQLHMCDFSMFFLGGHNGVIPSQTRGVCWFRKRKGGEGM